MSKSREKKEKESADMYVWAYIERDANHLWSSGSSELQKMKLAIERDRPLAFFVRDPTTERYKIRV